MNIDDRSPDVPGGGAATDASTSARPAEARLTPSQLRELTDSLPHLVWTCLAEGPCDYLSRQWVDYTGIAESEQLGYGWLMQLHPDDRERVKAEWGATVGDGVAFDIEFRIRRADGVYRWFRTRAIPIRDAEGKVFKWYGSNTDIDDGKRAEDSLRASEEFARRIIDSSKDCIKVLDLEGHLLSMSEGGQRLLQIDDIALYLNKSWINFWQGKDREAAREAVSRAGDGETDVFYGYCETAKGEPKWWEVIVSPIDEGGRVQRLLSVSRDITARRRDEESLRESEQRFRQAITFAPIPMIIHDEDDKIIAISAGWTRLSGYTIDDIPTMSAWTERAYGERGAFMKDYIDKLFEIEETVNDGELTIQTKDGGKRVWDFFRTPLRALGDDRRRLLSIAVDQTERRSAELAVKELNEELERRVEARTEQLRTANQALEAADARITKDRALVVAINEAQNEFISAANPLDTFDALLKRLLALTGSECGFIDEMLYEKDGTPYLTARAITNIAWNEESRGLYPKFLTGELRFTNLKSLFGAVMTTGAPVISNDDPNDARRCGIAPGHPTLNKFLGMPLYSGKEFVGVLGLANAPGGYNEEIIAYLEPLVRACANIIAALRTSESRNRADEELRQVNAKLEASNAELGAFSYSVAHDLRAPLRGMNGFANVLLEDYGDKLDAEGRDCLQEIHSNATRMGDLIDALLSLSRVTRSEIEPSRVNLGDLARAAIRELAAAEPERRVEVVIADGLQGDIDPYLARVLVENLLGNAWKFTKNVSAPRIEVGTTADGGARTFFVRDNGAGFDMAYADKLFAPFQRLHTVAEYPGTGIGLATAQRIVHRHKGRIWAEGAVNAGATFYFTVPTGTREATT